MDIRLIAFDLDGTFLDDDKHIPPENLRAMERAAEKVELTLPMTELEMSPAVAPLLWQARTT